VLSGLCFVSVFPLIVYQQASLSQSLSQTHTHTHTHTHTLFIRWKDWQFTFS